MRVSKRGRVGRAGHVFNGDGKGVRRAYEGDELSKEKPGIAARKEKKGSLGL